jgi:hypothetical protein
MSDREAHSSGIRRRPRTSGEGGAGWSPMIHSSSHDRDEERWWLDHEIEMLERALAERGEMERAELGKAVGGRYWGPGRFGRALREAGRRRAIAHPGRGRYAPAGSEADASSGP